MTVSIGSVWKKEDVVHARKLMVSAVKQLDEQLLADSTDWAECERSLRVLKERATEAETMIRSIGGRRGSH